MVSSKSDIDTSLDVTASIVALDQKHSIDSPQPKDLDTLVENDMNEQLKEPSKMLPETWISSVASAPSEIASSPFKTSSIDNLGKRGGDPSVSVSPVCF